MMELASEELMEQSAGTWWDGGIGAVVAGVSLDEIGAGTAFKGEALLGLSWATGEGG